nr:MAG TPA: helix-turn-helix domain-containing protein [Caudoviricetes sp.]
MDKAVLLSIRPEWCKKILDGEKTMEVRKTRPRLETPFKAYIYCTMAGSDSLFMDALNRDVAAWNRGGWPEKRGRVIGEFTCDEVYKVDRDSVGFNFTAPSLDLPIYTMPENNDEHRNVQREELTTCLTDEQLSKYLGIHPGFGWHISDLKIYDNPRKLKEFTGLQSTRFGMRPVKVQRPPQNWRYVEELK